MDVLFVAPSALPYPIEAGAAETCMALAKAIHNLGHRVTVVAPYAEEPELILSGLARRLDPLAFELGEQAVQVNVHDGRSSAGIEWALLEHEALEDIFEDGSSGLLGQAVLARACAALISRERAFDVVHFHGEETALACACAVLEHRVRALFSVYSLVAPLEYTAAAAESVGFAALVEEGRLVPAAAAVRHAQRIVMHAPSAMKDRVSEAPDAPLSLALAGRARDVSPLGVGLDPATWNPLTDALIAARYTPTDLTGKARNKSMLQRELGLEVDPDVPLLGAVESAVSAERLPSAIGELVRADVQIVIQVLDEDAHCADALIALSQRVPHRLQVRLGDSQKRAHRIVAASDALLVAGDRPVLSMAAQRYGTLPIAWRGSLSAEAIVDIDAKLTTGNGILVDDRSPTALVAGARRAIAAFNRGRPFERLRSRIMLSDQSWERSARQLEHLYLQLGDSRAA